MKDDVTGAYVRHEDYGDGRIVRIMPSEYDKKGEVTVAFVGNETKKFLLSSNKISIYRHEEEYNLLSTVLMGYGFTGFYHYTDFSNFIKIMEQGKLLSRNNAMKYEFCDAANRTSIAQTPEWVYNYVRFFYGPKTPTLYRNEGIKSRESGGLDGRAPHMPIPVALVFDDDIAMHEGALFLDGSAGNSRLNEKTEEKKTTKTDNVQNAIDTFPWRLIFARGKSGYLDNSNNGESGWDRFANASETNRRNAEFLYPQEISIKYLRKIKFRSIADLKMARCIIGDNILYEVDSTAFHCMKENKINYLENYSFDSIDNCALNFHNNPLRYKNILKLYFRDGKSKELILNENNVLSKSTVCMFSLINIEGDIIKIEFYIDEFLSAIWKEKGND